MVFLLLVSELFRRPLTFAILVGGEELKWRQLKTKLISLQDLILVQSVQLKTTVKVQISGSMASIGISDVVSASVYSEKTRMKKFMMKMIIIIIVISIMNKSQETTVFHGRQKLTSAKVMVDFKLMLYTAKSS